MIIILDKGDELRWTRQCSYGDEVLMATKNGFACRFSSDQIPSLGRKSRGSRALTLRNGDVMADFDVLTSTSTSTSLSSDSTPKKKKFLLVVTERGYGKRMLVDLFPLQRRKGKGRTAIKFKNKDGNAERTGRIRGKIRKEADAVVCLRACDESDEVVLSTSAGTVTRQHIRDIPVQARLGTGVRIQRLREKELITMVDILPSQDQDKTESDMTEKNIK
eukprot:CAMPEP_0182422154 /NCGR_PEP_ID=MMETSP1167-20130531/7755_1 /TAXON_ID=2988 /ORGANISM="Mallomonas Sp, Strain CCMP3275" /LENGTH=218 /DNA_ID=CAMNT_0024599945 /DNA_START=156 /DNA_END=812 /DNA_ORIENTATION=+